MSQVFMADVCDVGGMTVHVSERRVTCKGRALHLAPKTFDLLVVLVQRAGRLVTKRQLLDSVWHDTNVNSGILTVHIAALRRAFGDDRTAPRYIETISGYGYRLIASVRPTAGDSPPPSTLQDLHV